MPTPTQPHQGSVVCPHYLASAAGRRILHQGGSAVDAAVAVNAVLSVVYPHMTGLGGDGFWLIYQRQTNRVYGLNGSGRAGGQVTRQRFAEQGLTTIPQRGPKSVITVPGGVSAWASAQGRFGRLPWAQLLQPAIELAEAGYPVSASQAGWTRLNAPLLRDYSDRFLPFLPGGEPPQAGEILTNPTLAATLRQLATGGPEAFYRGDIARQIVAYLKSLGGWLTEADFADHTSTWVDPITTRYRGYTVGQLPPNTQGFTVLQMLNLIEPFDLQAMGHGSADYYHLLVEATKLAFADRDRWLGDPAFHDIPLDQLISKGYSDRRRPRISMTQAQHPPAGRIGGDTVYSAVVDGEGNAVSVIQSLYFDFGSAVVPPGLGFALQNRGALFSLEASHINALEPGKRPFHTLIPGLVLNGDGTPYLVLGTMGGEGQPQTQLALLTRVLDFGFTPQAAVELPRWVWGRTWGEANTGLTMEGRISATVRQELSHRGHPVNVAPDWTDKMGHAHMIRIDPMTQALTAGCDPRSDGAAPGL
ncbi:MAG: gamma-glutamyltransferase [Nodosilinea sp.]